VKPGFPLLRARVEALAKGAASVLELPHGNRTLPFTALNKLGKTNLVTHDVDEAITLADRVIVLQDGRVALEREAGTGVERSSLRGELLSALGVHVAA
jgi:ABC-type hemin transport system ATPase subunit